MALARFILRNSAAYVKIKKCKNTPDLLRMPDDSACPDFTIL